MSEMRGRFEAVVGMPVTVLAYLLTNGGDLITTSNIANVFYRVYRHRAGDQAVTVASTEITPVSSVVFNSLQGTRSSPDKRWENDANDGDDGGYNFLFVVPGSAFDRVGTYRIEVTFVQSDDTQFKAIWDGPVHSSAGAVSP